MMTTLFGGHVGAQLPATSWTVVMQVGAGAYDTATATEALNQLCKRYWFPLYAYVRRRGASHAEAEDLVQSFLARFAHADILRGLRRENGRFRAFLLASLRNHIANERKHDRRQKRGGGMEHVPLELVSACEQYEAQLVHTAASPEKSFDRAWALTLLQRVLDRLAQEKVAAGDAELFQALKPLLTVNDADTSYAEIAKRLNKTEGAIRVAACRLRGCYQELLRREIEETCHPAYIREEIAAILAAFTD